MPIQPMTAYRVFDSVKTGLCLYVGISGSKTWYYYCSTYIDNRRKKQSYRVGSVIQFSLERARKEIDKLAGRDHQQGA